jgi:glycosyltransferase involved in cell wall biosynthesis
MPRVLVDVSQWAYWPAATGVQRVLDHLAAEWQGDEVEAAFGFLEGDSFAVGPIAGFASVMRSRFEQREQAEDVSELRVSVLERLRSACDGLIPVDRLARSFLGYLLPEPTFRDDSLSVFASLSKRSSLVTFALYYDALPLTHPEFFRPGSDRGGRVTRYHHAVSRIENVAFISAGTRRVFETRIARRPLPKALVALPGADGLSAPRHVRPATPRFCMVGTIEPRKRYTLVLDVFERLWAAGRPYELVIVGRAGGEERHVFERLERLSRFQPLRWIDDANDADVLDTLSHSTALVFLSEAEGYGLPPIEALSVGCPVIVHQSLPALEGLAPNGQVRLRRVTPKLVHAAIERLADPVLNTQYRAAIEALELPTWERFARDIEQWIARRLREGGVALVA